MKRIFLWFKIRSLEITVDGRESVMHLIADPLTRANMEAASDVARAEIRRLRREYAA